MNNLETQRILKFNDGEIPGSGHLVFQVETELSEHKLNLIKEVILQVSKFKEYNWPSDEEWDKLLPYWFLNKIKNNTLTDIINSNNLLWDYGSWLDAMKFRNWEWYSSKLNDSGFIIVLEPISFPFSVNPLEYVIYETGIPISKIEYQDFTANN